MLKAPLEKINKHTCGILAEEWKFQEKLKQTNKKTCIGDNFFNGFISRLKGYQELLNLKMDGLK